MLQSSYAGVRSVIVNRTAVWYSFLEHIAYNLIILITLRVVFESLEVYELFSVAHLLSSLDHGS